ncbi:MAG TPA: heme-binding protein, partial [Candidatus Limnocylindria bacterium]|nr:heme-binding protein [Candidatus Limnocylindria bacterium]
PESVADPDVDEEVALAGQVGFAPERRLWGSKVFVGGISLAYVYGDPVPAKVVRPLDEITSVVPDYPIVAPPPVEYPPLTLGGVNGELRQPILDDPALHDADPSNDTIRGQARLTAAEVRAILDLGANRARTTRGGIRLPRGRQMQCFISVVANPNQDGAPPAVLGTFCTSPDATRFSWDVAVQKARTALFFSDDTRAFSSRTVGFLSQKFYPPGIINTQPGIFLGLQERFDNFNYNVQNPLNDAIVSDPAKLPLARVPLDPNLPNGITIFPGGFPLYRNGVIIGAVGVSGDGIDQDDIVAASATVNYLAPLEIRADRFSYRGARLPYAKFPRNPAL